MKTEWISVKDRLPDKPEEYIVWGGQFVTTLQFFDGEWQSEFVPSKYLDQSKITHWMPLPEPPKP